MKYLHSIMILCLLTLLSFPSLHAEQPAQRGIQIIPKAAPALDSVYDQSYAVIIGINFYDKFPALEYAVKDARAIEKKLLSLGFQTTTLLDRQATKGNILKILGDELPRKVEKNDRVILFFAGHGRTEKTADGKQMGYMVPVDADIRNVQSTAISLDQVLAFSRRLEAKHVLYLIDAGVAGPELAKSGTLSPDEPDYLQIITGRKAHQILTAGDKGELAHLDESGLSIFTASVLEALRGAADREAKGFITFSDMAAYVKSKVADFTKSKQVPQYGSIAGEGEFVLVSAGLVAAKPAESPGTEQASLQLAEDRKRLEEEKRRIAEEKARRQDLLKATPAMPGETGRDGRFIAYDNGTVLDTRTKLMWAAKDNGANINWQDAKTYCKNYRGGGYTDWRMPTQDELAELFDETLINTNAPAEGCGGGYHLTNLIHLTCCCPWASETRGSMAAYFGFSNAPRQWLDQSYLGSIRVLPVRSGK
jgi:uncharacterized caspase-like protein